MPGDEVGVLGQLYAPAGGVPNTIQFPPISLNGLGIFVASAYGPPQIAKPIPSVKVGATYILIIDGITPPAARKNPSVELFCHRGNGIGVGTTAGNRNVPGKKKTGTHFHNVLFNALNAEYKGLVTPGTHPMK